MKIKSLFLKGLFLSLTLILSACTGSSGPQGSSGPPGVSGAPSGIQPPPTLQLDGPQGQTIMTFAGDSVWKLPSGPLMTLGIYGSNLVLGVNPVVMNESTGFDNNLCSFESTDCSGVCIVSNPPFLNSLFVVYSNDNAGVAQAGDIYQYQGAASLGPISAQSFYTIEDIGGLITVSCNQENADFTDNYPYVKVTGQISLPNLSGAQFLYK